MDPNEKAIADLQRQIGALQATVDALTPIVKDNEQLLKHIPRLASVPVSNSPVANGYVPFFINGQRVNLLTGS